ncbi:MAG TPA: gamma carbonic anhydrase family protein [Pseudorhodoplanes sp.]|jgi:carbonic anhydrase/acetyltransferase-like protein (isoleucine patch superfamily)|nr:gamma carbonic anhydrase family protein [Pseudorhodoplanes sp.]
MTPLILPYAGIRPQFASPLLHAGTGSAILGRVTMGRNAWVGPLVLIRADGHVVRVGDDFHIGARSTLHIAHEVFADLIGDRVAIGENSCVHACTVGDDVVIGNNVIVLDGAVVENNTVLESGTVVFPGKRVAGGFVYAGAPAKPVRPIEPGEIAARRAKIMQGRDNKTDTPVPSHVFAPGSDIHPTVFVADTATVRGRIRAAANTSIWFSNQFDAGAGEIVIGLRTNIQDNTSIRCSTSEGMRIGQDSTVGHNVTIEDCVIGNRCLIGIGSTVRRGTVVQDRVLLAAGAATEPGQVLESGFLYAGSPARKLSALDEGKLKLIDAIIGHYCQYAQDFKAAQEALKAGA